eukprot:c31203_g1_i1 orf=127-402(+)
MVMACLNVTCVLDTKQLSKRTIAKALRIHSRNVIVATLRLQRENDNGLLPLVACHRQVHRTSTIMSQIKDIIFEFWTVETCVFLNKKDLCR